MAIVMAAAACTPSEDDTGSDDATERSSAEASEDEEEAAATPDVDPCGLLTAEEVGDAVGATAEEGRAGTPASGDGAVCEWTTDAEEVSFVQLLVSDDDAADVRADLGGDLSEIAEDIEVDGATDGYALPGTAAAQVGDSYVEVSVVPEAGGAATSLLETAIGALS